MRKPSNIGVSPTPSQKLIYIANKLKLNGIADMQGTTFNIFDTVPITTNTGRQTLNFFSNTSNKSRNFSNLQQGTLQAGEAMLAEEVSFIVLELSGTDLSSDATAITNAYPVQSAPNGIIPNQAGLVLGMFNLVVANSRVIKDANTFEMDPAYNPRTTGMAVYDTTTATNVRIGESKLYTESSPVIPPNQKITLSWEIGPTGTVAANTHIMCIVGRFGSIFSAKTNL